MEKVYSPPYSHDISPCGFNLIPKLKDGITRTRYSDHNELESAVTMRLRVLEHGCLAMHIQDLLKRWKSVIEHKGYSSEKMLKATQYSDLSI